MEKATVTPAVNQVKYHIGMGVDPIGLVTYCKEKGIVVQAYSPLGDGSSELIDGPLVTPIAQEHNKTGAQVSLKWLVQSGIPLSTKVWIFGQVLCRGGSSVRIMFTCLALTVCIMG